jgi:putative DNA primase/helicase
MRDLASPVGAFARERCVVGPDKQVAVDELYKAFKDWAEENEQPKSSKAVFGRDLKAVAPGVRKSRLWGSGNRCPVYTGISLQARGEVDF